MTDNFEVVFQNCASLPELVPGLYNEICHDGNQVISIKAEKATDTQNEENPIPEIFPILKGEHVVSCKSVCLSVFQKE
jgi:hypothetical protein